MTCGVTVQIVVFSFNLIFNRLVPECMSKNKAFFELPAGISGAIPKLFVLKEALCSCLGTHVSFLLFLYVCNSIKIKQTY